MRERLMEAQKAAMKAGDKRRLLTVRMILSGVKDRDIAGRTSGADQIADAEIVELMAKLIKSRKESAKLFEQGGRPELAAQEREEIEIIRGFMPKQMDEAETKAAITALVGEIGAAGVKDMGRVMAALKERYAGQMDFARASGVVKAALSG